MSINRQDHIFNYEGLDIRYQSAGSGHPLLMLHGWGSNLHAFDGLIDHLAQDHRVIAIDFPGFGNSPEPSEAWDIRAYARMTGALWDALAIENPIIIGHSFGARVALILAAERTVDQMILTGAAGIKPKRTLSYHVRVNAYKIMKRIASLPGVDKVLGDFMALYQKHAGSKDYRDASPIMKQVLVKVVNDDLTHLLKDIKASTLLIWGEDDTATPLKDGELMSRTIPDAGLVVLKNAGHYAFLDQPDQFRMIVDAYLKEETATC